MKDWHSLAEHGDQWLVSYACIPPMNGSASLFSIGHAVELYLKAAHTFNFGDINLAIKNGHDLKSLWFSCKENDALFMPSYQLQEDIFSVDILDFKEIEKLTMPQQLHLLKNFYIYFVFKHLVDLKYLGLPWKTRGKLPSAYAFIHLDPQWIYFFRDLRSYLNHPSADQEDQLARTIKSNWTPSSAANYLSELYKPNPVRG